MMPVKEGCTRASQGRSLMGSNPYVEFYLPLCEKIAEMYVLYFTSREIRLNEKCLLKYEGLRIL